MAHHGNSSWILRARCADFGISTERSDRGTIRYFEDGAIYIVNGRIQSFGPFNELCPDPKIAIRDVRPLLVLPGFIDCHLHYCQLEVLASHGATLLDWLRTYTFPSEIKFADPKYCQKMATFAIKQLYQHGTTTAQVFATVHKHSVAILFEEAKRHQMCLITGKVMMDMSAPKELCQESQSCLEDCQDLIDQWHGYQRLHYAVTPRFALTSSNKQLDQAGSLLNSKSGLYCQTHLSENLDEITAVKQKFPQRKNYLDVYDYYGLLGSHTTLAHGVHLSEPEWQRLAASQATIAFCPSSNMFLGSGLFDFAKAVNIADLGPFDSPLSLGSDVGGGYSISMFATLKAAYLVCQLNNYVLDPLYGFFLATRGGAQRLRLDLEVGSFDQGCYADFIIIDPSKNPFIDLKIDRNCSIEDELFALMILADDRVIAETFIAGQSVYAASNLDLSI